MQHAITIEAAPGLTLRIVAGDCGICGIAFSPRDSSGGQPTPLLEEAVRQLQAYFAGDLGRFNLPLEFHGTPFQIRAWRALSEIPYGETRSYGEQAAALGIPKAVRAVGAANGANPIAIVAPCHRVIGANGKLTGYGGGLPVKRMLLELEAKYAWRHRQAAVG